MTDIAARPGLEAAMRLHQSGDFAAAEDIYRQILQVSPRDPEALRLLGLVALQRGEVERAAGLIEAALSAGATAFHHLNLGMVREQQDRHADAVDCYRRALALDPDIVATYHLLGDACCARRNPAAAVSCYRAGLARAPQDALLANKLATVLWTQGEPAAALALYRQAVAAQPDLAVAHFNLANLLQERGDLPAALAHASQAAALDPADGDAQACLERITLGLGTQAGAQAEGTAVLANYRSAAAALPNHATAQFLLAGALQRAGSLDEAEVAARRALNLDTAAAEYHFRLGTILDQRDEPTAAGDAYDAALAIRPNHVPALLNRGLNHLNSRAPAMAVAAFDRAIAAQPTNARAHLGLAMAELQRGHWQRGWAEYEWRLEMPEIGAARPATDRPEWRAGPIRGQDILLVDEQGIGDAIQFVRYAALVAAHGARVTLRIRPALRALFSSLDGIAALVTTDEPLPPGDLYCMLLSLPQVLGTTPATVPAPPRYLRAEPRRLARWRQRLGAHAFKIAICWHGGRKKTGIGRSFQRAELAPLARLAEVRLISVQRGDGLEELDTLPATVRVELPDSDFDAGPDALVDTAAILETVDLVITCDTSIAHLAGALGRPTWIALQEAPDWRWGLAGDRSAWYPSVRLFRQTRRGDWAGVFAAMHTAVVQCLAARGTDGSAR